MTSPSTKGSADALIIAPRGPELGASAIDEAAMAKAGRPKGWMPYIYQRIDGGVLITGCLTRTKKSGPNKGEPMFLTSEGRQTVCVTRADIDRQRRRLAKLATSTAETVHAP